MKKITSLFIALAMLTSVSCSAKNSSPSTAEPVSETVEVKQTIYKERKITLENRIDTPAKIASCGDKYYFLYQSEEKELRLAVLDNEFNILSDTVLRDFVVMDISANVNDDGSFCVISVVTDFEFEMDEFGVFQNYDEFLENGDISFMLSNYDSSGNMVSEHEIIGLEKEFEKNGSRLGDLCPYGEGKLILSYGNGLAVIGTDGSLLDSQHYEMQLIDLGCDSDGKVIASEFHGFGYMDGETLDLPKELLSNYEYDEMLRLDNGAVPGNDGFKAYFKRNDGIYGLTENGELILVFDFAESLVKDSDVSCFAPCGNGMFLTASYSSNDMRLYTRRPDDFKEDRETVNIWYISGGDGGEKITEFSKSNDKFLGKLNPSLKLPDDLTKAILSDTAPDVIEYGDSDLIRKLLNLGALADMNSLMDEYGGLEREELMPNVLEAFDMDGHIYALPEFFSVKQLIANSDFISKEYVDWTYDDLYRFYEKRPEGMHIFARQNAVFNRFCINNLDVWIDTDNNTCKFGTPEFIKLLNFCKETKDSYIPEPDSHEGNSDLLYQKELSAALKDHTTMFTSDGIGGSGLLGLISTIGTNGLTFDTASVLNFPENGGTGTMLASNLVSVMESSNCKEGAWAYVSFLLGEERQCSNAQMGSGFNWVNKKAFDISLNQCIHKGSEPEMSSTTYCSKNGATLKIEYPSTVTSEQAEEYRRFILNCTKLEYNNYDVCNILYEEYDRFINDEITAEQCSAYIQDRVEILLGEQQ